MCEHGGGIAVVIEYGGPAGVSYGPAHPSNSGGLCVKGRAGRGLLPPATEPTVDPPGWELVAPGREETDANDHTGQDDLDPISAFGS